MARAMALVPALLLLIPLSALAELGQSPALTQLRAAAETSQNSVYASSPEGASSGNQKWAENSVSVPGSQSSVAGSYSSGQSAESAAPQPAPRPNLVANIPPATPKAVEPDPVPPKIKGWEGFKMGFLGMEATGMRLTSKAGKLALPLLILLQPIIAPIALIAGLLGLFGKRL